MLIYEYFTFDRFEKLTVLCISQVALLLFSYTVISDQFIFMILTYKLCSFIFRSSEVGIFENKCFCFFLLANPVREPETFAFRDDKSSREAVLNEIKDDPIVSISDDKNVFDRIAKINAKKRGMEN